MTRNILILVLMLSSGMTMLRAEVSRDSLVSLSDTAAVAQGQGTSVTYESAAQAYRDQNYQESIALYEEIIAQEAANDMVSAQLYYNLGNACYRDNQLGKAILNYERALLLDPGNGDIRHNLRFAQNRTVDRIDTASDLFLSNWYRNIRNLFGSDQWAKAGIVLFILFLGCVGIYLFVSRLWVRKSAFYTGLVLFFLVIVVNLFAFSQKKERQQRDAAIVMAGAASVNASPDANSKKLFELHEGTKVKIRNRDGNWFEIRIADGSVGWIQQENVEII